MIPKAEREQDRAICKAADVGPLVRRGTLTLDARVESIASHDCVPSVTIEISGEMCGDAKARAIADWIVAARERLPAYIDAVEEYERALMALVASLPTCQIHLVDRRRAPCHTLATHEVFDGVGDRPVCAAHVEHVRHMTRRPLPHAKPALEALRILRGEP